MKANIKFKARDILDSYLTTSHRRRTPERYTILDAIYNMTGYFSLADLDTQLEKGNFRVSRATLYNTMHLFVDLRLVSCHRFQKCVLYEASYDSNGNSFQICSVCGKITVLHTPKIDQLVKDMKLKRFRKDRYSLYIYGVCSSCQAKLTRNRTQKIKKSKLSNKK
ncbi:MAG: transcriptional repressor [Prevotella sp.]|jgi:Fur family ferric uptake transcriptional regulator|nr:transcriptional repressor [Prevotella sp.]MCH3993535.1 transcriptional repressor [Prevotella sp.]